MLHCVTAIYVQGSNKKIRLIYKTQRTSIAALFSAVALYALVVTFEFCSAQVQLSSEIYSAIRASRLELISGNPRSLYDNVVFSPSRYLRIDGSQRYEFPLTAEKKFDLVCSTQKISLGNFTSITLCRSFIELRKSQLIWWGALELLILGTLIFLFIKLEAVHASKLNEQRLRSHKFLHDLQGPLATIKILTKSPDRSDDLLNEANDSIKAILRAFTRDPTEDANIKPITLISIIKQIQTQHASITIDCNEKHCELQVNTDQARLFYNLVKNACEASSDKSNVTITTEKTWLGRTQVTIHDNGPGIPRHILRKMKTGSVPTLKEHGSGLGLFSAHTAAQRANSKLSIKSRSSGTLAKVKL